MPWYMKSLITQAQTNISNDKAIAATDEISLFYKLSQSLRALIIGSEALMRPMATPHRQLAGVTSLTGMKRDVEDSVANAK